MSLLLFVFFYKENCALLYVICICNEKKPAFEAVMIHDRQHIYIATTSKGQFCYNTKYSLYVS